MTPITPKQWREERGWNLEDLAGALGQYLKSGQVTPAHLSFLENGKRLPSFDVLDAYEIVSEGQITKASFKFINQ